MDGGWMVHESCIKRRFLILFLHKRLFDQTSLSFSFSLSLGKGKPTSRQPLN